MYEPFHDYNRQRKKLKKNLVQRKWCQRVMEKNTENLSGNEDHLQTKRAKPKCLSVKSWEAGQKLYEKLRWLIDRVFSYRIQRGEAGGNTFQVYKISLKKTTCDCWSSNSNYPPEEQGSHNSNNFEVVFQLTKKPALTNSTVSIEIPCSITIVNRCCFGLTKQLKNKVFSGRQGINSNSSSAFAHC